MIEYLDLEDLVEVARRAVGEDVAVRDHGLLESALARPRASVFGQDAYQTCTSRPRRYCNLWLATMHWWMGTSGSRGLLVARSWPSTANGSRASEDQRFELVIRVATGDEQIVDEIAEQLRAWSYR